MTDIYAEFGVSRQGHFQSIERAKTIKEKELLFVGFIIEIRKIHPGMGLRLMYEQFQPSGIGRDAFIALGLYNGFRLKTAVDPQRTTFSDKSSPYPNLIIDKELTHVNQLWVSDLFYFHLNGKHYYICLLYTSPSPRDS